MDDDDLEGFHVRDELQFKNILSHRRQSLQVMYKSLQLTVIGLCEKQGHNFLTDRTACSVIQSSVCAPICDAVL